jgi:murein DD-endopeptidase MepM/ murein hydrolase activator NlpD
LPGDAFAVRAYTQASFDGGQYKFAVRGDDGFQIFAKNIDTNEWIYITPKDEWQQAYGSHQEITYDLPQGRYDLHFHYFEGGGNAYFDLSWEKIGGAVVGGGFNAANFRGDVKYGINIRSGPGTSYGVVNSISSGGTLSFDGWKVGTSHYDQEAGRYDNRWFRIQGTDNWVASAYIYGGPNNSVFESVPPSTVITPSTSQSPLISNPTSQNPLTGFSSPLGGNLVVNQGNGGTFSHADRMQYAIDFDAAIGTSVYAMRSGKVIAVRDVYPDTGGNSSNSDRFNYVLIEHDGGYRSAYLHLQQSFNNRVGLRIGDIVNAGQLIGYSGNSGWSTGPHLHVEVHKPGSGGSFGQTVPFTFTSNPSVYVPVNIPVNNAISSEKDGKGFVQWYSDRYQVELKQVGGSKNITDRPTWIVTHGWKGSPDDKAIKLLADTIKGYQTGDQVLFLDWSQPAQGDLTIAASWIPSVAKFAVDKLTEWNISKSNINLVGHSLGTFVSYEIAKKIGGVSRLIALDPASDLLVGLASTILGGLTGGYNPADVNFSKYSEWSWSFYGSQAGSTSLANTAKESFQLDFGKYGDITKPLSFFELPEIADRDHGGVIAVFTQVVKNNYPSSQGGRVSKMLNIANMRSNSNPWILRDNNFEAIIKPIEINGIWSPATLDYYVSEDTWWNPFDNNEKMIRELEIVPTVEVAPPIPHYIG